MAHDDGRPPRDRRAADAPGAPGQSIGRLAALRTLATLLTLAALVLVLAQPWPVHAAEPSPVPVSGAARTCSERFPAQGPAGVDLQLGCMVNEIVSAYTGAAQSADPERLSTWITRLGVFTLVLVGLALLGRNVQRGLDRRMAPASPDSWWSCPGCRSLNADHVMACYGCGRPWTSEALSLATTTSAPRPGGGRPGTFDGDDRDE